MQIESLEIKNYRVFKDVELKSLPRLTALVGANGTGKSTLFDVFSFLKDALAHNVGKAVSRRGGFKELVSRGTNGPIAITIKFRETGGRLATYELIIDVVEGRTVIDREILKYRRSSHGKPWHFVDFSRGSGTAITNEAAYLLETTEQERKAYVLDEPDVLAIKGLGQFKEFQVVSGFRNMIENWHISDFHISDARPSAEDGFAEHLATRGDNVALVAQYLYENHRYLFNRILYSMKERIPGITDVEAKPTEDGRLVLRFQDGSFKDPFIARYVSDGTIKMFAYLVLLNDPRPFPVLAIEEPENQLYPELLPALAEEFRSYAEQGGQVFISTHSPDLLNGIKLEEIFWLTKKDGFTKIHRAGENELLQNLVREGDLPGYLWKQGLFEQVGQEE
ncbi:MAG: AAA family ATPase [Deltaproteobacteria bacterium]|nr:AAA family ATPase [Deltaproteobacteria bacterium]